MKLLVLGATGKAGGHLLTQALDVGHEVTALVRTPSKLSTHHARLRIVTGDVLDRNVVEAVMPGHDAVLSTLGTTSRGPTTLYSAGITTLLNAMAAAGVRRLICTSSAGVEIGPGVPLPQRLVTRLVVRPLYRHPYADMRRMEAVLDASALDWTVIRAPMLTDGPRTGTYRYSRDEEPLSNPTKISRRDLADFMLAHVRDPATYRTRPEVSY